MTSAFQVGPGEFFPLPDTGDLPVVVRSPLDAFGRVRVSSPATLFESKQSYNAQPDLMENAVTGAATAVHSTLRASTLLSVSAAGDTAIRASKRAIPYQAGKSQLLFQTFVGLAPEANATKRVGLFTDDDGVFLESSDQVYFVIRSDVSGAPVETKIPQSAWNVDPLNGTGRSSIELDFTKAQILVVDLEWLGVGTVRLGFVVDGNVLWAHVRKNANVISSVYMSTATLPARWEIRSAGAGGAASFEAICVSVSSEGGQDPVGILRSADRGIVGVQTTNVLVPVLSIRLRAAPYLYAPTKILGGSLVVTTSANARWELVLNPTVTGGAAASWSAVAASSYVEADAAQTGTVSGGTRIASGYFTTTTNEIQFGVPGLVQLGTSLAGVRDVLVLAAQNVSNQNETFFGALQWLEL